MVRCLPTGINAARKKNGELGTSPFLGSASTSRCLSVRIKLGCQTHDTIAVEK